MKFEYNDFIGIYKDLYPEGYCQHLIKEFDRLEESGAGANRLKSEGVGSHIKKDHQIAACSLREHSIKPFKEFDVVPMFFDGLQKCYEHYTETFSILKNDPIKASVMKMQKTSPGGGYHVWHSEQGPGEQARRALVYMLYLNSISKDGGGETEFLYQRKRYNPIENEMILWPASYTHTHRGNTVLSNEYKYIVTGWFYYD